MIRGKVTHQVDDDVVEEIISPTQVKLTAEDKPVYISNEAGYIIFPKKYITAYIQLKKKDKVSAELRIKNDKIKFIAKMYNYEQYVVRYQIPTNTIELLREEYGLSSFRFYVNVTIIIDFEKETQKLILEVPYWELKNAFDSLFSTEEEGGEGE